MSKIVNANEKIEKVVVDGYKKIEDKFVDTFLKKEGETIEKAKERVQMEQEQLAQKNKARIEKAVKISETINNKYVK